ncbi:MAG: 5-oxoprolinase [Magnetovibrio sp.]|nr:5-oxoprolinase [Magnetovibrio sp.]
MRIKKVRSKKNIKPPNPIGKWQFWIDCGGTFTDIVARKSNGEIITHKLLSKNPEHYSDAAIEGIRNILGVKSTNPIPSKRIKSIKMGTTIATNALLERKGEATLLVTTKGFKDALRIGYQNRPRLFDKHIQLTEALYSKVIEVEERLNANGDVLIPLAESSVRQQLKTIFDKGLIKSIAIVFMHAYRFSGHEKKVAKIASEIGFRQISVSHKLSPLIKFISRGDTTVIDSYLTPILRQYVNRIAHELGQTHIMFMQSNGGLTDANLFQGKDSILSGPAGGVIGMVHTACQENFKKVIGFDMGGTSTDVSHYNGAYERTFETQVAGIRMRTPMMDIHTVAAGGGSILHFDNGRYQVGPDSAGALPGPSCYRRGGPLTIMDCNLMLGKIKGNFFPNVFGKNANQPLDHTIVKKSFSKLAYKIEQASGKRQNLEEIAEGFLTIAVENMANAIKKISVQRGYNITDYVLNCFGGAGGQHACLVADALGMKTILIHPLAGVLSAYGIGLSELRAIREHSCELSLNQSNLDYIAPVLEKLKQEASNEIECQGKDTISISIICKAHIRYDGTNTALSVDFDDEVKIARSFEKAHRQRFGFIMTGRKLIIETLFVEAIGATQTLTKLQPKKAPKETTPLQHEVSEFFSQKKLHQAPVYLRENLIPGNLIHGPAIIIEKTGTIIIEPEWKAKTGSDGQLILSRNQPHHRTNNVGTTKRGKQVADPVMLEIFNNLFMSIAEQMGMVLANTAHSVNIKERLDFSCAIFDRHGGLVANAPHIPVHLGSMGESVQTVIQKHGAYMSPGDVSILNTPYNGGTHLPDITLVTPVFEGGHNNPVFYVASRGHHADVGGITPGSMPPFSTCIEEEGVLIDNFLIVKKGRFREEKMRTILASGPYPARNPDQNIADLMAQIAANEKGARELHIIIKHYGLKTIQNYMRYIQDNAEESVRQVIDRLEGGSFSYKMDCGATIKTNITIDKKAKKACINFTGTSPQQKNNFNAPYAITKSAVLYVFRTLVDQDIPLNEGCLKPIDIVIPEGSMLHPKFPAAVVAGNVETSQAIVDTLYGALKIMAASQGTMNNLTFGNKLHQYYETICGGSGAGPNFDGTDAVHSHMTNSRLTDPEILETRFPVLLESFTIRHGSGGKGKSTGGNGVIRQLRFLKAMSAGILSGHRRIAPFGLAGGGSGDCGENILKRGDGTRLKLSGTDQIDLIPGDILVIKTPGGGGYGSY